VHGGIARRPYQLTTGASLNQACNISYSEGGRIVMHMAEMGEIKRISVNGLTRLA